MAIKSESIIMSANVPRDIFTMNPDTLDREYEDYCEAFKPKAYSTIQNFIVTQKITSLYRMAKEVLNDSSAISNALLDGTLQFNDLNGNYHEYRYMYFKDTKISKMYVTVKYVVYVTDLKYRKYYDNYLEKTKSYRKISKKIWENVQYTLPKVVEDYETVDGSLVIVVEKPHSEVYPLREILDYFGGSLRPEYVASITTRLQYLLSYLGIVGINHNGITLDNLFFAPGRRVGKGEEYTIKDVRFVGVYGGWFFSTYSDEKTSGLPREVFEIMPEDEKACGYSSYRVDELSIRRIGRELLGENFEDVSEPMRSWFKKTECKKNAYEEQTEWEHVNKTTFGKIHFVEMDVPND